MTTFREKQEQWIATIVKAYRADIDRALAADGLVIVEKSYIDELEATLEQVKGFLAGAVAECRRLQDSQVQP